MNSSKRVQSYRISVCNVDDVTILDIQSHCGQGLNSN